MVAEHKGRRSESLWRTYTCNWGSPFHSCSFVTDVSSTEDLNSHISTCIMMKLNSSRTLCSVISKASTMYFQIRCSSQQGYLNQQFNCLQDLCPSDINTNYANSGTCAGSYTWITPRYFERMCSYTSTKYSITRRPIYWSVWDLKYILRMYIGIRFVIKQEKNNFGMWLLLS
jgi:hypothetical protein